MQLLFVDHNLRAGEMSGFSLLVERQKLYLFGLSSVLSAARHPHP